MFSDARFDSAYAGHNLLSAPPPPHHTLKTAMLAQLQSQTELYETAATYLRPSPPPPHSMVTLVLKALTRIASGKEGSRHSD